MCLRMGDLVMQTRVSVTKRNLRRIADLRKTLGGFETDFGRFLNMPKDMKSKVEDLRQSATELLELIDRLDAEDDAGDIYDDEEDETRADAHTLARALADELFKLRTELNDQIVRAQRLRDEMARLLENRKDVKDFL